MTLPTIATATDEEVKSGELGRRLRHFNYGFVGEYAETQPIWLNAKDADSQLAGGLRGYVFLHWLQIDILFVEEAARAQGLGSRLLGEAEQRARALGAKNAKLETFEFQARAFYLKHGYTEFGRIDDFARAERGYYLAYMRKAL